MNQTQRYYDSGEQQATKRFRHAYVIKPGQFDFSALKPFCERIVYATDGYGDHIDSIREQLEDAFASYDANKDVIIPVGSATVSLLAGTVVRRLVAAEARWDSYAVGIFLEGQYHFWRVHLDPAKESYEILLR